jgi:hypothetical protein
MILKYSARGGPEQLPEKPFHTNSYYIYAFGNNCDDDIFAFLSTISTVLYAGTSNR